MRRQRNRPLMKEQEKSSVEEINKMYTNNLPPIEFKSMLIRILRKLRGRMDEIGENINRDSSIKRHRNHKKESAISTTRLSTKSIMGQKGLA